MEKSMENEMETRFIVVYRNEGWDSILGSILGSPYLGKLPYIPQSPILRLFLPLQ